MRLPLIMINFNKNLVDCTKEPRRHPIIKQIYDWERQSISIIRQVAEDARKLVLNNLNKHKNKITENIVSITRQLNKARQDDNFDEIDLKEWMQKCNKLKSDLALSDMINIRHGHDTLITRLIISIIPAEVFGQAADNIHMEDNGQIIVHGQPEGHGTARGKGEYSMGKIRFRFKIEHLSEKKWVFFGIVSKNAPVQRNSRMWWRKWCLSQCYNI
ncbi:unnamed protein product [Rotaria sp. Silwood2]|nr:unnamed protein product [Rotaria sp. Silwood2]CAF4147289.1 unnamed protein product [Rotaria sp. Silwood2]